MDIDWPPLLTPSSTWAHLICCSEKEINVAAGAYLFQGSHSQDTPASLVLRFIRAERCRDWGQTYSYWEAALQFPYHPGYNTRIFFDECITDLNWLPADHYIFIVTNANLLLTEIYEGFFVGFLRSLEEASRMWVKSTPSVSFHVLFHCVPSERTQTEKRYYEAGILLEPRA